MKVVLDIETVQAPRAEWARILGIDSLVETDRLHESSSDLFAHADMQEQRGKENELYEKSAFDGTFSRIVCIGLLIFSDTMVPQGAVAWYGRNEQELLRQFWTRLREVRPSLFITHNGLGFDLPFLKKRSMIQHVRPSLDISLARFRVEPVYDTMAVWSNWDPRGWVKLDVLARALNVAGKSGSGKQVADMWAAGQWREIAEYCLQDTFVTYACYQRMVFQTPRHREEVLQSPQLIETP
ncbi:MAG: hypothetical protein GKS05_07620 [Nitrospirales bacterium]|nr:hypothetical protein [Nitrospirales bacterium]